MDFFWGFFNAFLFGALITLTIRWSRLCNAAHKLKSNQNGAFGRMIEITSEEILHGVIRKRQKQVWLIMNDSTSYAAETFDEMANSKTANLPKITTSSINAVYNSIKEKGLSMFLIPNEDIYLAVKEGTISNKSSYYLNDEIIKRLSNRELNIIDERNRREKERIENAKKEQLRKQKEQEIEDRINI